MPAMPHLPSMFSFTGHTNDDPVKEVDCDEQLQKRLKRNSSLLRKIFKRHHGHFAEPETLQHKPPTQSQHSPDSPSSLAPQLSPSDSAGSRRVIPSLPRPQTFQRRESERRDKLLEVRPQAEEKRALSVDRRREREISTSSHHRPRSPLPIPHPSISTSSVGQTQSTDLNNSDSPVQPNAVDSQQPSRSTKDLPPLQIPSELDQEPNIHDDDYDHECRMERVRLEEEYDRRWILNLSMQFRDKSSREKFFVTYAETPTQWRRVTVSLDYRSAPEDSLEADLSSLQYQRDKSFRIYEAIRESLPEIQYYDTVTNLKLETTPADGQLHVHVREDANEIISFPAISLFDHVKCPRFNESALEFHSHLSGFVYKVRLGDQVVIKKEIPGPDTVDEFLYEVNALDSLLGAKNVVQLIGLVTDDRGTMVKGLLISYAPQGALVDMMYDYRGTSDLPWRRREKWARQIVNGLSEIHEAGFVQGDFTLSNIVIDGEDNALIIDVNRRGCPVGWEPPELTKLIDSGQRVGMCIGVKTDLFQLGMVLWALAEEVDDPESVKRPLPEVHEQVPRYFRNVVKDCLSERPQERSSAKDLLSVFEDLAGRSTTSARRSVDFRHDLPRSRDSLATSHRSDKEYIDPAMAVTIDDLKNRRGPEDENSPFSNDQVAFVEPNSNPTSTSYRPESTGSWVVGRRSRLSRGRSPVSSGRRRSSPFGRPPSSATSMSDRSPIRPDCEERGAGVVSECKEPRTDLETALGGNIANWSGDTMMAATADDLANSKRPEDNLPLDNHQPLFHDAGTQTASNESMSPSSFKPPPPSLNKLFTTMQDQTARSSAELLHTDSGFDEPSDNSPFKDGLLANEANGRDMSTYHVPTCLPSVIDEKPEPASTQLHTTANDHHDITNAIS